MVLGQWLLRAKSKYQIKLAGEGKFMPDLVKMAVDLDICGQVNFVGKLSQGELAIELNRFVNSST